MEDSLYWMTSDVLEPPCTISPFYIAGGVYFLLVLHLWYWEMRVVHHGVHILVIYEVSHIMLKQTILGNLKCWLLWAVDEKIISVLDVVSHRVIFLYQAKGQDVFYSLGVIPHRISISLEITNLFGVCHSCVTMNT